MVLSTLPIPLSLLESLPKIKSNISSALSKCLPSFDLACRPPFSPFPPLILCVSVVVKCTLVLLSFSPLRLDTSELKTCSKVPRRGGGRVLIERLSRQTCCSAGGGMGRWEGEGEGLRELDPAFSREQPGFQGRRNGLSFLLPSRTCHCAPAYTHTHTTLGQKFPNELVTSGLRKQKPLWVPAPPATCADALIAANCHSVPFSFSRSFVYF